MSIGFTNATTGGAGIKPENAVIAVTAPKSSSIAITKGTTSIATAQSNEGHIQSGATTKAIWYFPIDSTANNGTFTVAATEGSNTASKNITLSASTKYAFNVSLEYITDLYVFQAGTGLNSAYTIEFENPQLATVTTSKIIWCDAANTGSGNVFTITPKIDLTSYKDLNFEFKGTATYGDPDPLKIAVGTDKATSSSNFGNVSAG